MIASDYCRSRGEFDERYLQPTAVHPSSFSNGHPALSGKMRDMATIDAFANSSVSGSFSHEENELLTRVGPGTPMGELFRQYWIPVVPVAQLKEPGGKPLRIRLLGEDLVAFRTRDGVAGVVGAYCSHRLAPLYFGRIEADGIRCP